jgi:cation-transporting ATPase E
MKELLVIFRRNFLAPIVVGILILAIILLILGDTRDAWFISFVIVVNTIIGVVQEVRAQRALKKLELLNAPKARKVQSDGTIVEIHFDELKVGDTIELIAGDEIPADGKVLKSSGLEVDESILTGESASVDKGTKALVYAGAAVVAGSATIQVTAVGVATKAGVMTATLRRYSPTPTPLQRAIARAITWLTFGALFLSVLIFIVYFLAGENAVLIFKTITSAAVTIVPEGLLLASTLLLAFGSLRLAQAKVLPQKLSAIEAMALINILCVDKTGTLTSDIITFESLELIDKKQKNIRELIAIAARETSSGSSTGQAIIDAIEVESEYQSVDVMAFSSVRKMGGARIVMHGRTHTIFLGAPEFLSKLAPISKKLQERVDQLASEGQRVLLAASFDDSTKSLKSITEPVGHPLALIILSNKLREGVQDTVTYFQKNNVSLRVISGDNPSTVSYIARQAGIKNPGRIITGAELALLPERVWDKTVLRTTIFARVLPEQKERLIKTFKRLGYFTGMVGDGVNDALALKKADLSVAMNAGAAATRRVADIVLLNNSFNSLPLGMRLGNRIMQAIELIASLFFHKIIYTVMLLLTTLAMGIVYPFDPRHITFMNIFLVTLPTIMWTLFPPLARKGISPKFFWRNTLFSVAPIAAISGFVVATCYAMLYHAYPHDYAGVTTTTVLIATFFGIYLVFLVPKMLHVKINRTAGLARILYIACVLFVTIPSFGFDVARDFFSFVMPAGFQVWPLWLLIIGAASIQFVIADYAGRRLIRREAAKIKSPSR